MSGPPPPSGQPHPATSSGPPSGAYYIPPQLQQQQQQQHLHHPQQPQQPGMVAVSRAPIPSPSLGPNRSPSVHPAAAVNAASLLNGPHHTHSHGHGHNHPHHSHSHSQGHIHGHGHAHGGHPAAMQQHMSHIPPPVHPAQTMAQHASSSLVSTSGAPTTSGYLPGSMQPSAYSSPTMTAVGSRGGRSITGGAAAPASVPPASNVRQGSQAGTATARGGGKRQRNLSANAQSTDDPSPRASKAAKHSASSSPAPTSAHVSHSGHPTPLLTSLSQHPLHQQQSTDPLSPQIGTDDDPDDNGEIRCICGIDDDDGYTIQCDKCFVWQHAACVGINRDNEPEHYFCEKCDPRELDVRKAVALQKRRIKASASSGANASGASASGANDDANDDGPVVGAGGGPLSTTTTPSVSVVGSPAVGGGKRGRGAAAGKGTKGSKASAAAASGGDSGTEKKRGGGKRGKNASQPASGAGTPLVQSRSSAAIAADMAASTGLPPLPPSVSRLRQPGGPSTTHSRANSVPRTEPGDDTEVDEAMSGGEDNGQVLSAEAQAMLASSTLQGQRTDLDSLVHSAYSLISQQYDIGLKANVIPPSHANYIQQLLTQANSDPQLGLTVVHAREQDPLLSRKADPVSIRIISPSEPSTCLLVTAASGSNDASVLEPLPVPYAVPASILNKSRPGPQRQRGKSSPAASASPQQYALAATTVYGVSFASLHPSKSPDNDADSNANDPPAPISMIAPATPVSKGTVLVEYMGRIVPASQHPHMLSPFSLQVPGLPLVIDASNDSNIARFCRRSCAGNLVPHAYVRRDQALASPDSLPPTQALAVALIATRDIKANEPLTLTWSPTELASLASPSQCKPESVAGQYMLFECVQCPLAQYTSCALYKALVKNPGLAVVPVTTQQIVDPTEVVAASVAVAATSAAAAANAAASGHAGAGASGPKHESTGGSHKKQPAGGASSSKPGSPSFNALPAGSASQSGAQSQPPASGRGRKPSNANHRGNSSGQTDRPGPLHSPAYSSLGFGSLASSSANSSMASVIGLDLVPMAPGSMLRGQLPHHWDMVDGGTVDRLRAHERHLMAAIALIQQRVRVRAAQVAAAERSSDEDGMDVDSDDESQSETDDEATEGKRRRKRKRAPEEIDILADDSDPEDISFRVKVKTMRVVKPGAVTKPQSSSVAAGRPASSVSRLPIGKRAWRRQLAEAGTILPQSPVSKDVEMGDVANGGGLSSRNSPAPSSSAGEDPETDVDVVGVSRCASPMDVDKEESEPTNNNAVAGVSTTDPLPVPPPIVSSAATATAQPQTMPPPLKSPVPVRLKPLPSPSSATRSPARPQGKTSPPVPLQSTAMANNLDRPLIQSPTPASSHAVQAPAPTPLPPASNTTPASTETVIATDPTVVVPSSEPSTQLDLSVISSVPARHSDGDTSAAEDGEVIDSPPRKPLVQSQTQLGPTARRHSDPMDVDSPAQALARPRSVSSTSTSRHGSPPMLPMSVPPKSPIDALPTRASNSSLGAPVSLPDKPILTLPERPPVPAIRIHIRPPIPPPGERTGSSDSSKSPSSVSPPGSASLPPMPPVKAHDRSRRRSSSATSPPSVRPPSPGRRSDRSPPLIASNPPPHSATVPETAKHHMLPPLPQRLPALPLPGPSTGSGSASNDRPGPHPMLGIGSAPIRNTDLAPKRLSLKDYKKKLERRTGSTSSFTPASGSGMPKEPGTSSGAMPLTDAGSSGASLMSPSSSTLPAPHVPPPLNLSAAAPASAGTSILGLPARPISPVRRLPPTESATSAPSIDGPKSEVDGDKSRET